MKYKMLGTMFDRVFRNNLNANFSDIDNDIKAQKNRVDDLIRENPQPSEIVDARGGAPVLRDRLDGLDAQMAHIAQPTDKLMNNLQFLKKSKTEGVK